MEASEYRYEYTEKSEKSCQSYLAIKYIPKRRYDEHDGRRLYRKTETEYESQYEEVYIVTGD
jgi:hypothetical protein